MTEGTTMIRVKVETVCAWLLPVVAGAVFLISMIVIDGSREAQAQSSVRPPAGATSNAVPRALPRSNVPSRASVPTNISEGKVPGGSLGNRSNSEMWRAIRQGISGTVSIPDKKAGQLVQSEGDNFRSWKNGPLANWGAWGMAGTIGLLLLFFLIRGRVRIDAGRCGRTVTRFGDFERMGHWLLAISFIILAVTGLNVSYGKYVIMPVLGKPAFAAITELGKWLHNYVAFAFMAGLVMIFLAWVKDNLPSRYDFIWVAKGGGLFAKGVHPPAKKFNFGQKVIFWLVILGGASLALSGIALLFPFQTAMFAKTFVILNAIGFNLPTELSPLQEMQIATLWHSGVALILIGVIFAHIYIGTLGMEGAFDAMGSGEVDENWAKEHHSVWFEETAKATSSESSENPKPTPAE